MKKKEGIHWFIRDIDPKYSDIPIIICCLVSGLCDSAAFNAASVFVSMQTGNTVFMALGAAYLPYNDRFLWLRALVSIVTFWFGCFMFALLRYVRSRSKLTLAFSFLLQAVFIFISAALAQSKRVPAFGTTSLGTSDDATLQQHRKKDEILLLPLAFLAFQFGGQVVASRVLKFNEVPTTVLTSLYCDFFSDPKLFAPLKANPKRNRRLAAIIFHVLGIIISGWLQRSRGGLASPLWLAAGLKALMGVAWLCWKPEEEIIMDKAPMGGSVSGIGSK